LGNTRRIGRRRKLTTLMASSAEKDREKKTWAAGRGNGQKVMEAANGLKVRIEKTVDHSDAGEWKRHRKRYLRNLLDALHRNEGKIQNQVIRSFMVGRKNTSVTQFHEPNRKKYRANTVEKGLRITEYKKGGVIMPSKKQIGRKLGPRKNRAQKTQKKKLGL